MSLEKIARTPLPLYRIHGRHGFKDKRFTQNLGYMNTPKMVEAARRCGAVLQSAQEAVAFRLEACGQDDSDLVQLTRTVVVCFEQGGTYYAAVDDDPNPKNNIILGRADKGYEIDEETEWTVPKTDPNIKTLIQRARGNGKIIKLPESVTGTQELRTHQRGKLPAFWTSAMVRAILGDLAEPYGDFLRQRGYTRGYITLHPNPQQEIGEDKASINHVGFCDFRPKKGTDINLGLNCIVVSNNYNLGGNARGVIKEV